MPNITSVKLSLSLIIVHLCLSVAKATAASAQRNIWHPSVSPKHEVRAVWLTTIGGLDWPDSYSQSERSAKKQQEQLCSLLDKYQQAGINTILMQTRIRGTVIYPSDYEPWDGCLSGFPGRSPGYDALAFAISECHKRGMEFHAWVVALPVGKWNQTGCRSLRRKMPEAIVRIGAEGYMNPEKKQTAEYIAGICGEITRKYDIDGIHLDYIRYPETWKIKVKGNVGRGYITNIVLAVHDRVKSLKPWVKMSCSPIGKADELSRYQSYGWNAYSRVCQDVTGWLKAGLMDEIFPMMYFRGNQFYPFAIDWAEQSEGRIVVPGLGIYFMSPKEKNWPLVTITQEMENLRSLSLGHAYFRGRFLTDNLKGIYNFAEDFDASLSLVPPMTWADDNKPTPPAAMTKKKGILSWHGAKANNDSPYLTYNIYASRNYPVDTEDGTNIVAIRKQDTAMAIPDRQLYYAITAVDRYGNESLPLQEPQPASMTGNESETEFLKCDGHKLYPPQQTNLLDADMLAISTLQGQIVKVKSRNGNVIVADDIPEGVYELMSLSRKGYTHRLGFFEVRRRQYR